MTYTNRSQTRERKPSTLTRLIILGVVVTLVLIVALAIGSSVRKQLMPSELEVKRQQAQILWIEDTSASVRTAFKVFVSGLAWVGVFLLVAGAALLVLWGWKRVTTIYPNKEGLFPVLQKPWIKMDERGWLRRLLGIREVTGVLFDLNRNPTAGIELGRDGERFIQPGDVSAAQQQITTQAQVIQVERARASSTAPTVASRARQSTNGTPALPAAQQGVVIYNDPVPEPRQLPWSASHIEDLLEVQGRSLVDSVGESEETDVL